MAQVYPAILQASEAAKRALSEHEVVQLDTGEQRPAFPAPPRSSPGARHSSLDRLSAPQHGRH